MHKTIYRIASLILAFAMILGNTINTQAAGSVYYVSPTGNDANPGTSSAPFKTFAKANSMLTAGSTLNISRRDIQRTIEDLEKRHKQRVDHRQATGWNSRDRHEKCSDIRREYQRFLCHSQRTGGKELW